jgi:hypothetical protein
MQSCVVYLIQTAASWKNTGDISSVFARASWWFSCAQKMEEVVE